MSKAEIHNLKIEIKQLELLVKTAIPPLIPMYQSQLRAREFELRTLEEKRSNAEGQKIIDEYFPRDKK